MIKFFKNLFIRLRSRKLNKKALRNLVENTLLLEALQPHSSDCNFNELIKQQFSNVSCFDINALRCIDYEKDN